VDDLLAGLESEDLVEDSLRDHGAVGGETRSGAGRHGEGIRVAVFNNRHGDPLLEIWRITTRPQSTTARDVP